MIDLSKVSCCLNTKEPRYPKEILDQIYQYPFGEILILTNSDSPYCKYELFNKTKYDLIYYQDDDAICPVRPLAMVADQNKINVAMKEGHFKSYMNLRMTMGLGWGSFFPKNVLKELKRYTDKYGEDDLFKRDTEKILTEIVFPQNRFIFPIQDLPSAMAEDRLWRQPEHWSNMNIIQERCRQI